MVMQILKCILEFTFAIIVEQGFPSGLLNEGLRDSLCRVKEPLIMIQGFVVLKRL